jgi:ATP synthase F1 complex assembly factor 2
MDRSSKLLAILPRASKAASSLSACRTSRLASLHTVYNYRIQSRNIHNSPSTSATPLPHATVPAPPPGPPQQHPTEAQDRLNRKRQQAEAFLAGVNSRPSPGKPVSILKKRFWKDVSVKETDKGLEVYLDKRAVKTAAKESLVLPHNKRALATAIALEWDQLSSAQQALKNAYVPLTSGSSRAMDIVHEDAVGKTDARASIVSMAMRYLSTDTLLCWAPEINIHDPVNETRKPLRERQREVAEPIIGYLKAHVFSGCEINPILAPDSIVPVPQPQATRDVIRSWVQGLPAFELAGLERGILATKSLLIATRMVAEWSQEQQFAGVRKAGQERFGIEEATEAASLEVLHQTEQWGEVEDTHDVDNADIRRQLGTVVLLVT